MVSIPSGVIVAAPEEDPDRRTSARAFRRAIAGLLRQSAPGTPVAGILPGPEPDSGRVTGHATLMRYRVQPGVFVIARGDEGAYVLATVDEVELTTSPADSLNPRWDRIFVHQPDPELSDAGQARIDVAVGTPGSIPALPSLPAGSLELARKLVAAGATNTTTGAAFTNLAPITGVNTGVIVSLTDPGATTVPEFTVWIKPIIP